MPVQFQDEELPKVKAYYKYELAEMYNVCTKTFSAWIHMYLEELQQFGYTKHTKLLWLKPLLVETRQGLFRQVFRHLIDYAYPPKYL